VREHLGSRLVTYKHTRTHTYTHTHTHARTYTHTHLVRRHFLRTLRDQQVAVKMMDESAVEVVRELARKHVEARLSRALVQVKAVGEWLRSTGAGCVQLPLSLPAHTCACAHVHIHTRTHTHKHIHTQRPRVTPQSSWRRSVRPWTTAASWPSEWWLHGILTTAINLCGYCSHHAHTSPSPSPSPPGTLLLMLYAQIQQTTWPRCEPAP